MNKELSLRLIQLSGEVSLVGSIITVRNKPVIFCGGSIAVNEPLKIGYNLVQETDGTISQMDVLHRWMPLAKHQAFLIQTNQIVTITMPGDKLTRTYNTVLKYLNNDMSMVLDEDEEDEYEMYYEDDEDENYDVTNFLGDEEGYEIPPWIIRKMNNE